MTSTVYAYTPPGADFPAFVNLSRGEGIRYTLTVRSQGNAGRDMGSIVLFPDAVEALATAALADLHGKPAAPAVTDEMVGRFLAWNLPADFNPDGGVSKREGATPVGTNLLTAVQARAMLEHVLGVAPAAAAHPAIAAMQPLDNDGKATAEAADFNRRLDAACVPVFAAPAGLDLNDDTPLAPVCDLSGDGSCEACQ